MFVSSSEAISRKSVPPEGRLQRGLPTPTAGAGRGFRLRRNSALLGGRCTVAMCWLELSNSSYLSALNSYLAGATRAQPYIVLSPTQLLIVFVDCRH